MRGYSDSQPMIIAYINLEKRIPQGHPLRKIKPLADNELKRLWPLFNEMYSHTGRPSIPPDRVLKSLLLIALYSVQSERQFCEQMDYNLIFRWFLDLELNLSDPRDLKRIFLLEISIMKLGIKIAVINI